MDTNVGSLDMSSVSKEFAEIFTESENDQTFYGFSDSEISDLLCDKSSDSDVSVKLEPKQEPSHQRATPRATRFQLRVALRSRPPARPSSETEEEEEERKEAEDVKSEEEEKPLTTAAIKSPKSPKSGSDSETDVSKGFLAKRAKNIKANKAMLAQLMADLQKMPGGGGLLQKQQGGKRKDKAKCSSRPPRSGASAESRRNPERVSRRQTRSMGGCEDPAAPQDQELELSLEDELMEVRRAPRRRGNPRPNQSKPHVVRPVAEITEDELQLVADAMTEKVYNRVSGSTCHQCRQKTIDTKTCCRSEECRGIQGQFCGPCLRNRYGEDVKTALLDPDWQCPPCRGICNCSFCRARDGRCPTGILFPLAQYHGFSDVHSYLSSLRSKLKDADAEAEEDL